MCGVQGCIQFVSCKWPALSISGMFGVVLNAKPENGAPSVYVCCAQGCIKYVSGKWHSLGIFKELRIVSSVYPANDSLLVLWCAQDCTKFVHCK